jgi:hypothetical protein
MFGKKQSQTKPEASASRCSFCNKSQDDVLKLIAGPSVYICDECVEVCGDIIARERAQSTVNVTDERTRRPLGGFEIIPADEDQPMVRNG